METGFKELAHPWEEVRLSEQDDFLWSETVFTVPYHHHEIFVQICFDIV